MGANDYCGAIVVLESGKVQFDLIIILIGNFTSVIEPTVVSVMLLEHSFLMFLISHARKKLRILFYPLYNI